MAATELVRNWLIVEPPRVQFSILRPFIGKHALLGREDLNSHPSSLAKMCTFLLDISIRPSEELNDTALLTSLILGALIDFGTLPDEIERL